MGQAVTFSDPREEYGSLGRCSRDGHRTMAPIHRAFALRGSLTQAVPTLFGAPPHECFVPALCIREQDLQCLAHPARNSCRDRFLLMDTPIAHGMGTSVRVCETGQRQRAMYYEIRWKNKSDACRMGRRMQGINREALMRCLATCRLVLVLLAFLLGLSALAQDNVDEIMSLLSDEVLAAETGIVYLLHQVTHELAVSTIDGVDAGTHRKTERIRVLALPGGSSSSTGWAVAPGVTKKLVFARVLHADGSVTELEPNVRLPGVPSIETAPDGTLRSLDYGELLPGDILEYESIQESLASPHAFWLDYPLNAYGIPILRAEIHVSVPEGQILKWDVVGDGHAEVELSASNQQLHAVIDEIPFVSFDSWVLQLDELADYPRLTISSAPSWQAVAEHVLDMTAPSADQLLALQALAIGLSFESGSTTETIRRFGSFASNGLTECLELPVCPDFTGQAETWQDCIRDADCQIVEAWLGAQSLLAMLEAVGVDAYLAITSTFSRSPFSLGPVPALSPFADRYLVAIPMYPEGFQFVDPRLGVLWEMTGSAYEGHDVWVLDGSSEGQGQIVYISPFGADENTVHWDLQATMPSACRLEVLGTVTATGRSAYEWSQYFAQGDSDRETFASLWPGEMVMRSETRRYGTDSWIESLRVVSVEIGDPFVAEIAYERDLTHFGCFVDLTYFPGIETDISRLESVATYACEGYQSYDYAYPMMWSSDIVVTPLSGCDTEVSASNDLSHGPVLYDMASVWDGESLVLSRRLTIASEIDEASCEGLADVVAEIVADDLAAWFRVLP